MWGQVQDFLGGLSPTVYEIARHLEEIKTLMKTEYEDSARQPPPDPAPPAVPPHHYALPPPPLPLFPLYPHTRAS